MNKSVFMGEITWKEYARRLDDSCVLLVPVGALEQHGYHMGMSVDTILPTAVCERVAVNIHGLVAPTLQYGYKSNPRSGGGNDYLGTTSLDGATMIDMVRDLMREFIRHGVRKLVFVNGHFENLGFISEGVDLALREARAQGKGDIRTMVLSYWDFASDPEVMRVLYPNPGDFPGWDVEHGGVFETSLMLALRPDLVDLSKAVRHPPVSFPPYDMIPLPSGWVPEPGTLSSPVGSTAEKGVFVLNRCVEAITRAIEAEFAR